MWGLYAGRDVEKKLIFCHDTICGQDTILQAVEATLVE